MIIALQEKLTKERHNYEWLVYVPYVACSHRECMYMCMTVCICVHT